MISHVLASTFQACILPHRARSHDRPHTVGLMRDFLMVSKQISLICRTQNLRFLLHFLIWDEIIEPTSWETKSNLYCTVILLAATQQGFQKTPPRDLLINSISLSIIQNAHLSLLVGMQSQSCWVALKRRKKANPSRLLQRKLYIPWSKHQESAVVSEKESSAAAFWASRSFIWRSACSLSQALIPIIMSSIVPVVPKNTRGPRDFRFIPTGIARSAPAIENTQVPSALQPRKQKTQGFSLSTILS